MKQVLLKTLLALALVCPVFSVNATHIQGGNITYECLGANQYAVTLTMFFDCGTYNINTAGFSQTITVTNDCGLVNPTITANYVAASSNLEVSQLCTSQIGQSECASPPGTLPGVWQATWTGIVTLPAGCNSWHFWYSTCCWNANTNTPGTPGQLYHSTLNNLLATCDNSAVFLGQQIPYMCVNQSNTYSVGGTDPDGHNLVYSIVPAQEGSAGSPTNVPYNGGYTGASPIPGITINPATGVITVTPTLVGNYIMQVQVASYNTSGQLIGYVSQQFQIIVINCTNQVPVSSAAITSITGSVVQTGPTHLQACEGASFCLNFTVSDPNVTPGITVNSNIQSIFPSATVTITGTNPWTVNVCATVPPGSAPLNNLVFNIQDGACPIPGVAVFAVELDVIISTTAGPDQYYCPGGSTIQLNATGGSVFNWTPATGLSCTNCASPVATPAVTTTYIVTSNLTGGCKNKDTVTVFAVPSFGLTMNPASATICKYGSVQLNATPGGGFTPYTYSWSPTTGLSCTTCPNPLASPLTTTTYTLTTTSNTGCTRTDNITVTVSGVAPNVQPVAVNPIVCSGTGTQLNSTIYADGCSTTTQACTGPVTTITVGTGTFNNIAYSPHYMIQNSGAYSNRKQYLFTKAELDAMGFVGGGKISSIDLNYAVVGTQSTGMQIKMGCTSLTQFPDGNFVTGLSLVKTSFNHTPVVGWNTYTLTTGYMWDGQSNLIVEFCTDNAQLGQSSSVMYNTYASYYTIYLNSFGVNGTCSSPTGTRTTVRPNMRFTFCKAVASYAYSWTPTTGLSNPAIANPTANPASTTTYMVSVNNGGCVGTGTVQVVVAPTYTVAMSPNSSICLNTTAQLNATPSIGGAFTYSWSPTTGLSNPSIANPVATPTGTTTYTVTVTSAAGCVRTGTVTVTISGIAPIVGISAAQNPVCPMVANPLTAIVYPASCTTTTQACTGPSSTVTVGTGTWSTTSYSPHYGFTGSPYSNRIQYLYTQAELNAMGFTGGGKISSVALNYTSAGTQTNGMVIKMGCTSLTQFSSSAFDNSLTIVRPSFNFTPVAGWNTYTLTNAYMWDGVSNLIVEFCVDNAQGGTAPSIEYNTYGSYYMIYLNQWNINGACSVANGWQVMARPNTRFTYCAAVPPIYTYSWSPPTGLSSTAVSNPTSTISSNTTYTLTVSNGACAGTGTLPVVINNVNTVTATPNPNPTICPSVVTQLGTVVTGPSQPVFLPSCGVNGTACSQTQYYATAGTGTFSSTAYSPFLGANNDARTQYLIRASDLTAAGISSGTIREIAWNVITKSSTNAYAGFTISIGCTNETSLSTGVGWLPVTQVWTGSYTSALGWNNFVLTSPFDWNGTSNLVVQVCFNKGNSGATFSDATQYTSPIGYTATMYNYSNTNGASGCTIATAFTSTARPNIRFRVCPPPPSAFTYSWTPPAMVSNPTIANPTTFPPATTQYIVTVTGGTCVVVDTLTIFVCPIVLPVEFLSFTGKNMGAANMVNWTTLTEVNSDYFILERSDNEHEFEPLTIIDGAGNSIETKDYEFIDEHPHRGYNYYRLKQFNFDGSYGLSNTITINNHGTDPVISISPNPTDKDLFVEINFEHSGIALLEMFDLHGRKIMSTTSRLEPGQSNTMLDVSTLSTDVYVLKVTIEEQGFSKIYRVVKN